MKPVINQQNKFITEYDLEKGKLVNGKLKHSDGFIEDVYIYIPNNAKPKREVPISTKIKKLKEQLSASDYKIIKCIESYLTGKELPYDINELHAERQVIRDEINGLEV